MCDDIFDDYEDFDEAHEDEGLEENEHESDDDDFGPSSNNAGSNPYDCGEGIELDVILAAGFGYEMGYGERRRKRRDTD
jgi:hypothetical protein